MIQDMKTIMTRLFTVIMLMMISMGVEAQVKIDLGGEKNDGIYTGGTIKEKGQTKPDDNGLVTVTITVTPNKGYTISSKDITVVSTVRPAGSNAGTRTPTIAAILNPIEKDPVDLSQPRDYSYIVSSTFGVWVKEANFQNEDSKGGNREISEITSLDAITNADGHYVITGDISGGTPGVETFNGILEAAIDPTTHMPYRISGLNAPLFTTLTGTVKNLVLECVSISGTGNTGAIACTANGSARIYNVGIIPSSTGSAGSVSGTEYTGGLVGLLDGEARVVNCYSYANITGGTEVGGIVGHNNVATASNNLKTMVFACMFYGDITGGNSIAPIYNGINILNKDANGVSNFNYFRLEAPYVQPTGVTYNCALGAEDRFLQRFEFFRHLLNGHRELAGWWATGTYSSTEMMKWVLEPSQIDAGSTIPYPVLKASKDENGDVIQYPSVVNIDAKNATTQTERNKGGLLGTLTVNIQMGSGGAFYGPPTGAVITDNKLSLNITDKDPDHYNFNYYKVQLPYYNDVGTKNYNGNRVVTGWKIVDIKGGEKGSFSTGADATTDSNGNITSTPYNFADRHCTNKDLFSVSGRVFNQGAYWDVPEGVTEITIEPYWARCTYLADPNADKVYNTGMDNNEYNVPNVGGGQIYTNGNSYSIAGENQVVYTNSGNARDNLGLNGSHTVYDHAIVLVGNFHKHNGVTQGNNSAHLYTIMSIDADHDNEPDYSYILRFNSRTVVHPVRVDFINIPGLGMAQKSTGGTGSYNFGILQPKGWFESTNTSLFRVTQFEYDAGRPAAPTIVQGGVFEQWVGGQNTAHSNLITYFHVGGNVWFKEFHRGCHQDKTWTTKHPPVSVTGGDYDEFYLTGLYRGDVANFADNAECYINGGRFGTVCGAAMEGIGNANGADNTGNITWQVQNADIKEFYAGGLNAASGHTVTGKLTTVIEGGYIKLFCGGPKFGDMSAGKTVTTTATGCTFDNFFGAGYGGNSYSRYAPNNRNYVINIPGMSTDNKTYNSWNKWVNAEYKQNYNDTYGGVSTQIDYQFLPMSDNKTNVARLFVEFVKFSLATTRSVTSTLTGCTINENFYGGGSLGKVDGPITSTLDGCTVKGNVFGAGFSADLPEVKVDAIKGFEIEPYYYEQLGTYRTGVKYANDPTYEPKMYKWKPKEGSKYIDTGLQELYTTENLSKSNLGSVDGIVTLTIKGDTKVGTLEGTTLKAGTGSVFGGGQSSYVTDSDNSGNAISVTVNIQGGAEVYGNVFGGGDQGNVDGSTVVNIQD